jgi:hypothetical protein
MMHNVSAYRCIRLSLPCGRFDTPQLGAAGIVMTDIVRGHQKESEKRLDWS